MLSATKTHSIRAEKLAQNNDVEAAQKELATALSVLDKAAKKRVIHPNTAARRKSHLTKKFNKVTSANSDTANAASKTAKEDEA